LDFELRLLLATNARDYSVLKASIGSTLAALLAGRYAAIMPQRHNSNETAMIVVVSRSLTP
jgi:hypothetical protein